jgi:hypothetical protein
MQFAERVQRQQAESLFHNVVTELLVCQSLEVVPSVGRHSERFRRVEGWGQTVLDRFFPGEGRARHA